MRADVIAAALVAAAARTCEDPESFVERDPEARFRHYAFHALRAAYPGVAPASIAECVGCPGKPAYFNRSSEWHVLGLGPHRKTPVEWWSEEAFATVCRATKRALGRAEAPARAQATRAEIVVDESGSRRLAAFDAGPRPSLHPPKRDDFLQRALANTAKLTPPGDC